ncbi:MAG: hypothetical protein ACLFSL_01665 [Candidatus Woesearchaeota archaeon]
MCDKNHFCYYERCVPVLALSLIAIVISGCTSVMDRDDPPMSKKEFEAEARILSLDEGISISNARESLARTYPRFAENKSGYFSPPARHIDFINCTSTVNTDVFTTDGKTIVVYKNGGSIKRITLKDSCSFKTMSKYYCVGDRPAFTFYECSYGCWQEHHCK